MSLKSAPSHGIESDAHNGTANRIVVVGVSTVSALTTPGRTTAIHTRGLVLRLLFAPGRGAHGDHLSIARRPHTLAGRGPQTDTLMDANEFPGPRAV